MDKKQAKQILTSRKLVATTGKFTVKCTNTNPFRRENKDGSFTDVTIVNFAAMTPYQLEQAQELFKEGKFQEATNTNLSASQLPGQYIPAKGEIVDVEMDTIENKEGVSILVVGTIVPRKAEEARRISADAFSDEESEEEETVDATKAEAELV